MTTTATPAFAARARAVGIGHDDDWPYGANIDHQSRVELVAWAQPRRLRYSPRAQCLHWIATGRCATRLCLLDRNTHRWMDHVTGWTRDGKPAVLVCQPYGLNGEDLADLAAAAGTHGLDVQVDGTGWYGHGSTFVQLRRATQ